MKTYLYRQPKKRGGGGRWLSKELGVPQIDVRSKTPLLPALVINWGSTEHPNWSYSYEPAVKWLNHPYRLKVSVNKFLALTKLKEAGVKTLEFTANRTQARNWAADGHKVYCRQILSGSAGRGVVVATKPEEVVLAKLYTKGFYDKHYEMRVHIGIGSEWNDMLDYVQKKRRNGVEVNRDVRTHKNGWVYCHENVMVHPPILQESIKAVKALGLDFGAVDVLFYSPTNTIAIAEVNTAPGLECTVTKQRYVSFFKKKKQELT